MVSSASSLALEATGLTPVGNLEDDLGSAKSQWTVSVADGLCSDCILTVHDILTESTASSQRWYTVETAHDTLTCLISHLDGEVSSLLGSSSKGCELCRLILDRLFPQGEATAGVLYSIFIRPHNQNRHEFQVCTGDARRFAEHMSEWAGDPPKRLGFLLRHVDDDEGCSRGEATEGLLKSLGNIELSLPRLPNNSSSSERSFQLAHMWLDECRRNHDECQPYTTKLPKRLVDLGALQHTGEVHLCNSREREIDEYATVSYSWGESGYKRLKTMIKPQRPDQDFTEAENRCGIPFDRFPQTLKDAIHIAKRLCFRYIWIDSLCIVQDDTLDWNHQSAAMTEIYGGARLNISATSGRNSESGIFEQIGQHGVRIGRLTNGRGRGEDQILHVAPPLGVLDLEDKYASSRGWIFQERLVSVATIHYTEEGMVWECVNGTILGHDQGFKGEMWKREWKNAVGDRKQEHLTHDAHRQQRQNEICQIWYRWIESYSERSLFKYTDRFNAIAGVAKTLSKDFGLSYTAGLWSHDNRDLVQGLLWRRFRRTPALLRFDGDTTPTWSWASVQGRLEFRNVKLEDSPKGQNLEIVGQPVAEEIVPDTFGPVRNASIKVRGLLQQIVVDRWTHPGVRQRGWQECGVRKGFVNTLNVLIMLDNIYTTTNSRYYTCWCLRVGSYASKGRIADIFLLLEKLGDGPTRFRRIGFAETNPWEDLLSEMKDSGVLESPEPRELVLV